VEAASALHHLRHAVDEYDLLLELNVSGFGAFLLGDVLTWVRHIGSL
jgi:hypothetical protein